MTGNGIVVLGIFFFLIRCRRRRRNNNNNNKKKETDDSVRHIPDYKVSNQV